MSDEERSLPMQHPLHYIGYTRSFSSHGAEQSSSWFMLLVQAACRVELGECDGGIWILDQHLVGWCARPMEIKVPELFITLIANALHETGGGFGIRPAGMTSLGLETQSATDFEAMWNECIAFREQCTPYYANLDAYDSLVEGYLAQKAQLEVKQDQEATDLRAED
jgi:hypothetical protein